MTIISKAQAGFSSIMLRGGRITKVKGKAGSYAPQLGAAAIGASSSALAVGLLFAGTMALPNAAQAGTCAEVSPGVFECSGPADPAGADPAIEYRVNGPVAVSTLPGFGLETSGTVNSLVIAGATDASFVDNNASLISGDGILLRMDGGACCFSNRGDGAVNLSSNGDFVQKLFSDGLGNRDAIQLGNSFGGINVDLTGTITTQGNDALQAVNFGEGDTSVSVRDVISTDATKDATVTVLHRSAGAVSLEATGTLTNSSLQVQASTDTTDITVTANDITSIGPEGPTRALEDAAIGVSDGSAQGAVIINANGTIVSGNAGIVAALATSGDTTIIANDITAMAGTGISLDTTGAGAINIASQGVIDAGRDGIRVRAERSRSDIIVAATTTTANETAIDLVVTDNADVTITTTGATTGGMLVPTDPNLRPTAAGIKVQQLGDRTSDPLPGSLTINTNDVVTGLKSGIEILSSVQGGLVLNVGDDVTATDVGNFAADSAAINVRNVIQTGIGVLTVNVDPGVTLQTGSVGGTGVKVSGGSRTIAVNALDTTIIGASDGILAEAEQNNPLDIIVQATDVTGGNIGIGATGNGFGLVSVTATGTVSGGSVGIDAKTRIRRDFVTGSEVVVNANETIGGQFGIRGSNTGTGGGLSITTTGTTTGSIADGINAFNGSDGTSLTIAAGDVVMGGNDGIEARNFGSAGLTITADSDVTGAGGSGIVAFNSANDTTASMLISQAAGTTTTGLMDGISASNAGGSLTINALGDTVGTQGSGITATNNGNATTTTILANNASGGVSGIVTSSLGTPAVLDFFGNPIPGSAVAAASGDTTITLTGIAQGGTGAAIDTYTAAGDPTPQAGSLTTINLQAGAQAVAGASGVAIRNNEGNSVLNVADGASITGEVRMGDGSDIAMLAGANVLNGITLLDGGDDELFTDGMVDELTINGFTGTVNSGVIVNWEVVNFIGGTNEVEVEVPTVNTCGGDFSIGGAGTATQVLGCVSNDAQTVTGNAEIFANIEGAGGSDTISIVGGAIVDGIVFGGANGNDDSAAFDGGDMITIDTTGFVGGVDGGLGDDQINLLGGRVVNSVDGGGDNDMVTLAGAVVSADVAGGDGNDQIMLNSGSANSVLGGSGDDIVEWNSADATTQSVRMGSGSDTLNINDAALDLADVALDGDGGAGPDFGDLAFNPSLSSASVGPLSVGSAGVDTLNLNNGFSGDLVGAQTLNWDVININGGSVRFSDAAITTGLINVNGGGALDGSNNLAVAGSVAVSAGSRLFAGNATGSNMLQISGNVSNAGTVALAGPGGGSAAGDRLSIGGNYGGTSGSALLFDTVLGGSNATDLMVVGGDLGGNSTVVVTNVGGTGSLTTGSGIKLVQVDGTSAATALNLQGGTIDVGAFRYALVGADDQDWYLQSRARDVVVSTASVARVAQTMGLTSLGTLHERVGEQEHLGLQTNDSGFLRGMWGRALGKDYSENARSASLGDSRSNGQMGGLQMGVDVYRSVAASGARTHVGIFGGHLWSGTTDFGVNPSVGITGTTRSDGWTLGGYLTHYTSTGLYVDVVAQGDWIDHRANGMDGTNAVTKSKGFLASVEVGKAFGKVWKFEPQAQIIYGNTDIDAFTDSANVANRATVDDSVTGRAGFRVKRTWDYDKSSEGGLFTFYAKANIWARLAGGITTLAVGNSAPGVVQLTESWGDVGVGSTFSLSRNAEIFVDADVEYGINQPATALAGRGGLRLRF